MIRMLKPSRRFVGGAFAVGFLGVVLMTFLVDVTLQASLLDRDYVATTYVGGNNQCCLDGSKTTCGSNSMFQCASDPLRCVNGTSASDTCAAAVCQAAQEGNNCSTANINFTLNKCTANGMQGVCFGVNMSQCSYTTSQFMMAYTGCNTGSTLCPNQPNPACN